ncbi:uncharacterized protein [Musca autumnalis]|uniref:uncharacterized protein n=1 Tax=Musca autumnalis TaxID=221902 RepID=UPI003CEBF9C3
MSRTYTKIDSLGKGSQENQNATKTGEKSKMPIKDCPDDFIALLDDILEDLTDDVLKELQSLSSNNNDKETKDENSNNNSNKNIKNNTTTKSKITKKIARVRENHKQRVHYRKQIAKAMISEYHNSANCIDVFVNGWHFRGFIDTGSEVTCLGLGCIDFVQRNRLEIYPCYPSVIKTVDGQLNDIIGKIRVNVAYNGCIKPIIMLLVPSLKIRISIGLDLVNLFNLKVSNFVSHLYTSYEYDRFNRFF